jgi:hypothetical protein
MLRYKRDCDTWRLQTLSSCYLLTICLCRYPSSRVATAKIRRNVPSSALPYRWDNRHWTACTKNSIMPYPVFTNEAVTILDILCIWLLNRKQKVQSYWFMVASVLPTIVWPVSCASYGEKTYWVSTMKCPETSREYHNIRAYMILNLKH